MHRTSGKKQRSADNLLETRMDVRLNTIPPKSEPRQGDNNMMNNNNHLEGTVNSLASSFNTARGSMMTPRTAHRFSLRSTSVVSQSATAATPAATTLVSAFDHLDMIQVGHVRGKSSQVRFGNEDLHRAFLQSHWCEENTTTFVREIDCLDFIRLQLEVNISELGPVAQRAGQQLSSVVSPSVTRKVRAKSLRGHVVGEEEQTRMNLYRSQYYTNLEQHERLCLKIVEGRINDLYANLSTSVENSGGGGGVFGSLRAMISSPVERLRRLSPMGTYHVGDVARSLLADGNVTLDTLQFVLNECLHEWQKHVRFHDIRNTMMTRAQLERRRSMRVQSVIVSPPKDRSVSALNNSMVSLFANSLLTKYVNDPMGEVCPHVRAIQEALQELFRNFKTMSENNNVSGSQLIEGLNEASTRLQRVTAGLLQRFEDEYDMEDILLQVENLFFPEVYSDVFGTIKTYVGKKDDVLLKKMYERFHFASQSHLGIAEEYQSSEPLPFMDAVCVLRTIQNFSSPIRKIEAVRRASQSLLKAMINNAVTKNSALREEDVVIGGDDFVPSFIYCMLQAAIPNIGSELAFINCFLNPNVCMSEVGYYSTTLELAVEFLRNMSIDKLQLTRSSATSLSSDPHTTMNNTASASLSNNSTLLSPSESAGHDAFAATLAGTLETTLCGLMDGDAESRSRQVFILPRFDVHLSWSKSTDGLVELVESTGALAAHRIVVVQEWVKDVRRLVKAFFCPTSDMRDVSQTCVVSCAEKCSGAQKFFLGSVLSYPADSGLSGLHATTVSGNAGVVIGCPTIEGVLCSPEPTTPVTFTTDSILSAARRRDTETGTSHSSGFGSAVAGAISSPEDNTVAAATTNTPPPRVREATLVPVPTLDTTSASAITPQHVFDAVAYRCTLASMGMLPARSDVVKYPTAEKILATFGLEAVALEPFLTGTGDHTGAQYNFISPVGAIGPPGVESYELVFEDGSRHVFDKKSMAVASAVVRQVQCMLAFLQYRLRDVAPTGYMDSMTDEETANFYLDLTLSKKKQRPVLTREVFEALVLEGREVVSALTSFGFSCHMPATLQEASRAVASFQSGVRIHQDGYAGKKTRKFIKDVTSHLCRSIS
eukprot:PhM_4_TR17393/c0_g1_i1/m.92767